MTVGSQDISVGAVTGYGLDGWDLIPSRGMIFLFSIASRLALAHPASYPMGFRDNFPGIK
jgi:hypothetical protein